MLAPTASGDVYRDLLRTPKRSHAIDNLEEVSGLACPRCGHPASLRLWMNTGRQVG